MSRLPTLGAALFIAIYGTSALADPLNLVANGSFETSPFTANSQFGSAGYANLTGWSVSSVNSSTPFDLWFQAGTSTTQSATTQYGSTNQDLVPSFSDKAADGNDFVSLDGDPKASGVLSQTISGLKLGDSYTLAFQWAATQMQTASKSNYTIGLSYNLGASALSSSTGAPSTSVVSLAYGQSTGWMTVTTSFVATSAQEVLSFLASGTPVGGPPVALLDSVSLFDAGPAAVPEPASAALLGGAVLLLAARRRRPAGTPAA